MSSSLFPHDQVRESQDVLIDAVSDTVRNDRCLIVHAPTGLGKTAASIAPALSNTINTNKTIFFLTSMHTQHKIAIETLKDIKKKHSVKIIATNIIGKKHMCLQPGVRTLNTRDFAEYCRALREDGKCEFYTKLKKNDELTFEAKASLEELRDTSPASTHELFESSGKFGVCPYEISMLLGKESKVIVTDYYYLFHPRVRESFLKKTGKELKDAVIIVDEAHNLPNRIKDLASERLTNITLKRAITESDKFNKFEVSKILRDLLEILEGYARNIEEEEYITEEDFFNKVQKTGDYEEIITILNDAADEIREEEKQSYIGVVAMFLEAWPGADQGYARIFTKEPGLREEILRLSYRCLDPGVVAKPILDQASSIILMSGTLTPTYMYKEILGFDAERTSELTLKSPFPDDNRLTIIIPRTSTKFTSRSEDQYKEIANIIVKVVNATPGNSLVFLPSFKLRDDVYKYMAQCEKTLFIERQGLNKHEKEELLEKFKTYKDSGAVLLGVTSGSFGEGIDLPDDYLNGVVVVGLPLQKPDLETKAMIDYYEKKFGKGWDYGYIFPAFNKTLQSAGRCIRSEDDKGVMVFIDERYAWPQYMKLFPENWNLKTTLLYEGLIRDFFAKKQMTNTKDK